MLLHNRVNWLLPLVALATLAVTAASCPTDVPERVPNGNWGGDHMGMIVTDTGATLEYDCASGTITEPLLLDGAGHFDWTGVHHIEHGGPIFEGEPQNTHRARYTGTASSSNITITITLTDTTYPAQTYTMSRGANPRVFKCL